jgi:phosphatidylinositol glycan class B
MKNNMPIKPKYIYIAVVVYLITAFFSLGHLHPDEYYQILEFAAYKLNLNSPHGLTWEFYDQIRPAFQAWIVVYLYKLIALISEPNPFFVTFLTRAFSGALSLIAIILFINTFKVELKSSSKQQWFMLLSIFSWLAVFNGIRYSSENISAKLFLIGFCLLFQTESRKSLLNLLAIGFFDWNVFRCQIPDRFYDSWANGLANFH